MASISLVLLADAALTGLFQADGRAEGQSVSMGYAVNDSGTSASPAPAGSVSMSRPEPETIGQALESGVLIVVSKGSQRMHVFKDGKPWLTSPVSTGRRGHGTPVGVFPIIEKRRFHRSNIYSNAPMPFMQRLTMRGIAIHAGHLPGYPASHGCIRVPYGVARTLFGLTKAGETTVVIMNEALQSDEQARRLALAMQEPHLVRAVTIDLATAQSPNKASPAAPAIPLADAQPRPGSVQTIQLAAALSPQEAEAHWSWLISVHSKLGRFDKTVIPAVVGSRRYFRLRASGPGAFTYCSQLKSAGIDCFKVL